MLRRPVLERAGRSGLHRRRVVPLAERAGAVAVVLEDLGGERAALRDRRPRSRPSRWRARRSGRCRRGDGCARSAARRGSASTWRSCETGCSRSPRRRCGPALGSSTSPPKVSAGRAGVVDQHDEDVRRIFGQTTRLDAPFVDRLLHRATGGASRWRGREGKRFSGCGSVFGHRDRLVKFEVVTLPSAQRAAVIDHHGPRPEVARLIRSISSAPARPGMAPRVSRGAMGRCRSADHGMSLRHNRSSGHPRRGRNVCRETGHEKSTHDPAPRIIRRLVLVLSFFF